MPTGHAQSYPFTAPSPFPEMEKAGLRRSERLPVPLACWAILMASLAGWGTLGALFFVVF